jgi:hypothetical protein
MENTDTADGRLGEIELKLFKSIILKEVVKILEQVSNKDEDFLYPDIDVRVLSERLLAMNPLISGEFMGHKYEICTNGAHPTAYVNCGEDSFLEKKNCDGIPVHGGCTFFGTKHVDDGLCVGWDYGHFGDYMSFNDNDSIFKVALYPRGKKWTVPEVMQDVVKAILFIEENK